MDIKTLVNDFLRKTREFVEHNRSVEAILSENLKQIELDRERIIKDRAELIKKHNLMMATVLEVKREREEFKRSEDYCRLETEKAREQNKKAADVIDEYTRRVKDLEAREAAIADVDAKISELKELESRRVLEDTQSKVLAAEKKLLHEKQKALEVREEKIAQAEERLKRLHADV